jgi:hypothetical protein
MNLRNTVAHFAHFYQLILDACFDKMVRIILTLAIIKSFKYIFPIRHALNIQNSLGSSPNLVI